MVALTNYDLVAAAEKFDIPLVGVFSKDALVNKETSPPLQDGGYIINLNDSVDAQGRRLDGSHWTCFYIEGKEVAYFDSFGFGAPTSVLTYLVNFIPFPYNLKTIQNLDSGICGYYCLYFLYWMSRHTNIPSLKKRMERFLEQFSTDVKQNRNILDRQFKIFF